MQGLVKIGFPRALYYYDYFPFWAGFFYSLDIELVTSPPTHRQIMEQGLKLVDSETCLPMKLLAGHIQALKDVDGIFLPRIVSVERNTYTCPKLMGIPESIFSAVPRGMAVLTVTVNWRKGKEEIYKELVDLGKQLGKGRWNVRKAFYEGLKWNKRYQHLMRKGWNLEKLIENPKEWAERPSLSLKGLQRESDPSERKEQILKPLRIALVGHSYLTYEPYANLNILKKLGEYAEVELVQNVSREEIERNLLGLRKKIFWDHSKQMFGAGKKFAEDSRVDGIIFLTCFGCGTDSITQELVSRKAREQRKPYMAVTLDEHSGEAGLVTRLEAFLDMVERRKIHENNISPYGECMDHGSNTF